MNDQIINGVWPATEGINQQLARVFKEAPAAIALLEGPTHIYTYANPMYEKLYSRTEKQLIGRSLREVFPEVGGQGVYELFDGVYCSGKPFTANQFEVQFEDNGSPKTGYYNFTIQAVSNESDAVSGLMVHAYEVTEYVKAYRQSEESEKKYRSLFENTDHGCCIVEVMFDPDNKPVDYRFLEINKVFESQTGLKDPKGKTARELLPPLEEKWLQIYGTIALTGESARFSEDSNVMGRWFDVNAFKVGDIDSRKVAIIFNDVTSRKRTGEAIQQARNLLQAVYDSSPHSIAVMQIIYDQTGGVEDFIIRMLNQFTIDMIGNVEFVGRRYSEVFPNVRSAGILDTFKEVASTGVTAKFERGYDGEGMQHWFRFTAVKQGDLLVVLAEDMTKAKQSEKELKESEERFAAAVEAVEGIVWTNSADGKMEGPQPGWSQLTGQSFDEYQGYGWSRAVHPDDAEPTVRAWNDAVGSRRTFEFEHRVRTASGEWRTFAIKAIPLKDPDGSIRQWVGVHTDVTERVTAARELQESERRFRDLSEKLEDEVELRTHQLRQSNDDLQQFAHVASHDLKEPVRKIKTFTSRLRDEMGEDLDDKFKLYIDKVLHAGDRMMSMIEGVLAYSSINASELTAEQVDLNEVIENIKSDLEIVIQQKGACVFHDHLPTIQGARVLLYQLFYNLINNSIKFGRSEDPVVVTIESGFFLDEDKESVRILVKDNGIGFDQKFSDLIFNTFSRLNPKDKYEGTGLGLALCKRIALRHRGRIEATSVKGQGATFIIVLPIHQTGKV